VYVLIIKDINCNRGLLQLILRPNVTLFKLSTRPLRFRLPYIYDVKGWGLFSQNEREHR